MTFRPMLYFSGSPATLNAERCPPSQLRGALTLVELLVAMSATLLLLGAVVSLFGYLGDTINESKADIDMVQRLRQTTELLQTDLASLTLRPGPPQRGREQEGFFEYVDGGSDEWDTLHFTIRSRREALTGEIDTALVPTGGDEDNAGSAANVGINNGTSSSGGTGGSPANVVTAPGYTPGFSGQSRLGEVIWFVTFDPRTGSDRLHRYQLMVAPGANLTAVNDSSEIKTFLAQNDISATLQPNGAVVANSLEDLAQRTNRRAHQDFRGDNGFVPFYSFADRERYPPDPIPDEDEWYELYVAAQLFMLDPPDPADFEAEMSADANLRELLLSRLDETIVLDNVTEFDVKAWDPGVPNIDSVVLINDNFSSSAFDHQWIRSRLQFAVAPGEVPRWSKLGVVWRPWTHPQRGTRHDITQSMWTIDRGLLFNNSGDGDGPWFGVPNDDPARNDSNYVTPGASEGTAAMTVDLASFTGSASRLALSFDYLRRSSSERLYVHLFGYVRNGTPESPGTMLMNTEATDGHSFESSGAALDQYNLLREGSASMGTTGQADRIGPEGPTGVWQTYVRIIDLEEFTRGPTDLADYDYIALGFARRVQAGEASMSIDNLRLTGTSSDPLIGYGDYVDLKHRDCPPDPSTPECELLLCGAGCNTQFYLTADGQLEETATYDTWSAAYGYRAADGYDSDADGVVDEADEATTGQPDQDMRVPYPVPLQGIQVILSTVEPSTGNVRTVTIRQRFDN